MPLPTDQLQLSAGTVFQGEAPNPRDVDEIIARLGQRLANAGVSGSRACTVAAADGRQGWALVTPVFDVAPAGELSGASEWDWDLAQRAVRDAAASTELLGGDVERRRVWVFLVSLGESGVEQGSVAIEQLSVNAEGCRADQPLGETPMLPPSAPLLVLSYEFERSGEAAAFVSSGAAPIEAQFAAAGLWQVDASSR